MIARRLLPLVLAVAAFPTPCRAADPEVDPGQLPRVQPTAPDKVPGTFKVKAGFRLEQVAAEPNVVDPIALSFDENGRLFVVEMRDYSERRPERLGRIRVLEDTDGDGRFDRSTVFASDMPWPTAVICWDGGIFVAATPDILYLKDTDGDGVADVREVIFSGFASDYSPYETNKLNVQALLNSFTWSLDNRVHGATSFNGGQVQRVDSPFVRAWLQRNGAPAGAVDPLSLRGRDFSFDPRRLDLRPESGGGQYGLSFDNQGRKFVCSNSSHLQTVLYEDRYAARNAFFAMPRALADIAVDGGAAEVFRISPDEAWRVIRTRWRVSGVVPGLIEGGGRPSGYFTAATGVTIYRGNAFPPDWVGDAFVADCGSNLIHHKKVRPAGFSLVAERAEDEKQVEFAASTDNWFRPVQLANAPDGALYVCDMYREIIEHPWSLPPTLKKHLDLNSGNDRGRLYRIVPANFKQPKPPKLGGARTEEWVRTLAHANGWHRDTAARLLCTRRDPKAIPLLRKLAADPRNDLGRLHALAVLVALDALGEPDLLRALNDPSPSIRCHAVQWSEPFLRTGSGRVLERVTRLGEDEDSQVRLQTAFSLGESRDPARFSGLLRVLRYNEPDRSRPGAGARWDIESPLLRAAVLSSLADAPAELLTDESIRTLYQAAPAAPTRAFFSAVAEVIGARGQRQEITHVLEFIGLMVQSGQGSGRRETGLDVLSVAGKLGDGMKKGGGSFASVNADGRVRGLFAAARQALGDPASEEDVRFAALGMLAHDSDTTATLPSLLSLLAPEPMPTPTQTQTQTQVALASPAVQKVALSALGQLQSSEVAPGLVRRWARLTPELRAVALPLLLGRTERVRVLLRALADGQIAVAELSAAQRETLRQQPDLALRTEAERVLGRAPTNTRPEVIAAFLPALQAPGVASRGQGMFEQRCATCHTLGKIGRSVGPDLATVRNAGKEKILVNILDPNREVNPAYLGYAIDTKSGDNLVGIIAGESATGVTLRQAGGLETTLLRNTILSLRSLGKSLMPEGLEAGLTPQDMADLLEFIVSR